MPRSRTLYIKNPEARRLAREISRRTGITMTEAVIGALKAESKGSARPVDREKIDAICKHLDSLPVLDKRSPKNLLGYGKFGIPR